jgi:hypothetical protein
MTDDILEFSLGGHFICPKCGGTYFGSTMQSDGSFMRHCHGSGTGYGCGFSWHESSDKKYFYVLYDDAKNKTEDSLCDRCDPLDNPLCSLCLGV